MRIGRSVSAWSVFSGVWFLVGLISGGSTGESLTNLQKLDLRQVTVGGEIGARIDLTIEKNLLALDIEKDFLLPFRERNRESGFIGLGMLIDSAVKFAAHSQEDRVIALKERLVLDTLGLQEPDGYLGMLAPESRMWKLWDVHEMAYLIHGLLSDYRYFGARDSLEAARKTADYILSRWAAEPDRFPGEEEIANHMAVTGLDTALLDLYAQTQEDRYLRFCMEVLDLPGWNSPIVKGRWGKIEGHAYAYMSRCLAQLQLHAVRPDPSLLSKTQAVLEFLTRGEGLVVTGTCGNHECWHDSQDGGHNLAETCTTAYLLRFLDEVFRMEGDSRYGDIMERAIYNALFAAQSPDGRRIRYYTPFEAPRVYFPSDSYCCPNNYRRILAELPSLIYYQTPKGIVVNLYSASEARVRLREGLEVKLIQESDYPRSGTVTLTVVPSLDAEFSLFFRIPRWTVAPEILLNGRPVVGEIQPGSMVSLRRVWSPGDRVELKLPMEWRFVKGRRAQSGRVAVLRGPRLFSLSPSRNEGLEEVDLRMMVIDPHILADGGPDDSFGEGGLACRLRAWKPDSWYPMAPTELDLRLTEYPDPDGQAVYFLVPNPEDPGFSPDELIEN